MKRYTVRRFQDESGKVPYTQWIEGINDLRAISRIDMRLNRAMEGNFGDHKYEREGIWAMRLDCGPGYRLYYTFEQKEIILLIVGGDKKSQTSDINRAVKYWKQYQLRGTQ